MVGGREWSDGHMGRRWSDGSWLMGNPEPATENLEPSAPYSVTRLFSRSTSKMHEHE